MDKQNLEKLQEEVEKNLRRIKKRKRRKMKISGGSVKKLQQLIINKKI